ncbi:uncharacterized protein LOC135145775 isoform X2 [Zophobas morio]
MTSTVLQSTQMVGVMNDLMETLLLNCLSVALKVERRSGAVVLTGRISNQGCLKLLNLSYNLSLVQKSLERSCPAFFYEFRQPCIPTRIADNTFSLLPSSNYDLEFELHTEFLLESHTIVLEISVPSPSTLKILKKNYDCELPLLVQCDAQLLQDTGGNYEETKTCKVDGDVIRKLFKLSPFVAFPLDALYAFRFKDDSDVVLKLRTAAVSEDFEFFVVESKTCLKRAAGLLSELEQKSLVIV